MITFPWVVPIARWEVVRDHLQKEDDVVMAGASDMGRVTESGESFVVRSHRKMPADSWRARPEEGKAPHARVSARG